jgi:hypothetical protein
MNSVPVALVTLHEAADLVGSFAVVSVGAFVWTRLRRKDQLRRAAQKEREEEFARRHLSWDRERDEALRCHGIGVGR